MGKNEIMQMEAGRDLNILVAEKIMGTKVVNDEIFGDMEVYSTDEGQPAYGPLLLYSEDLDLARMVIDRMIELGYEKEVAFWENEKRPDVICRASLKTVIEKKREIEKKERKGKLRLVK